MNYKSFNSESLKFKKAFFKLVNPVNLTPFNDLECNVMCRCYNLDNPSNSKEKKFIYPL